jgi:hypothetical protein
MSSKGNVFIYFTHGERDEHTSPNDGRPISIDKKLLAKLPSLRKSADVETEISKRIVGDFSLKSLF